MQMTKPVIELKRVRFRWGKSLSLSLDIRDFSVNEGERLFLFGPSGSGKSTLLNVLAGVLQPEEGFIGCIGSDLAKLGNRGRDRFRADHIGMIFQQFNLVPYLSVLDNVLLPCRFSARRRQRAEAATGSCIDEAIRLLQELGLKNELRSREVTRLSVGQQQRVAVARALIGQPELIIADEPTSALDASLRGRFLELLLRECEARGGTLLFVSHDLALESYFTRASSMLDINAAQLEEPA
jgi:putative ABC transport system ATP-binding protein